MVLIISVVVAYLLLGYAYTIQDLSADVLSRPGWAFEPTLGKFIFYAILWPLTQIFRRYPRTKRHVFISLIAYLLQMIWNTAFVWCCISLTIYVFDNMILRIISSLVMLVIGLLFVLPIINAAAMFIIPLILWPIGLLFSENTEAQEDNE